MTEQGKRELAAALGLKPDAPHAEMVAAAKALRAIVAAAGALRYPEPAHVGPVTQPAIIGVGDLPDAFPQVVCAENVRYS